MCMLDNRVPYKNGRVDRDAVSGTMWTLRAQGTMFWAYVGARILPHEKEHFWYHSWAFALADLAAVDIFAILFASGQQRY